MQKLSARCLSIYGQHRELMLCSLAERKGGGGEPIYRVFESVSTAPALLVTRNPIPPHLAYAFEDGANCARVKGEKSFFSWACGERVLSQASIDVDNLTQRKRQKKSSTRNTGRKRQTEREKKLERNSRRRHSPGLVTSRRIPPPRDRWRA